MAVRTNFFLLYLAFVSSLVGGLVESTTAAAAATNGRNSLAWTADQLDKLSPRPDVLFNTFPGLVATAWNLEANKTDDAGMTRSVCEMILKSEPRVSVCTILPEITGSDIAYMVSRKSPSKVEQLRNVGWLQKERNVDDWSSSYPLPSDNSDFVPFHWDILADERNLAFIHTKSKGSGRLYRLGLKVSFVHWMVDPCSEENSNVSCDTLSTKCISNGETTNVLVANYSCECREWWIPSYLSDSNYEDQREEDADVDQTQVARISGRGCIRRDSLVRDVIVIVQVGFIVAAVALAVAVFTQRKTKVMSSSMWPVTEVVVIGSILIYVTILLRAIDQPSQATCIVEPWLRELGFSLCYGAIVLKIYRALVEFRTRKAHRWVVREKDIIRYLTAIFSVVLFYMTAWTVTNSFSEETSSQYVDQICPITWWHRVTEVGELLFVGVGLHMAYHLRNAVTPWNERKFYTAALLIETIVSVATIVLRESRVYITSNQSLYVLVLYFARSHVATSIILLIVFVPKFYYIHDEKKKRLTRRGDGGTTRVVKALDAINGDLDLAEVNLADMDPQDIRTELKRVYTQLELLRNKTMRKDNPHISKRRGGRKPTHRRFSLQALHRRNQRSFRYHGDDIEDSVCSLEGPSTYSESGR